MSDFGKEAENSISAHLPNFSGIPFICFSRLLPVVEVVPGSQSTYI